MILKKSRRGQNALLYIKERIKLSWLYLKLNKGIYLLFSLVCLILIINENLNTIQIELKNPIESLTDNSMAIYQTDLGVTERFYVTFYCSCYQCTGYIHGDYVIGAAGTELIPFKSVASSRFPMGTELKITHNNGEQEIWVVQDRGHLASNQLDLYIGNDHNIGWHNEYVEVQVLG